MKLQQRNIAMSFRKALALAAAILTLSAGHAFGQAPGPRYAPLNPPQPTEGGGKIEVIEFFWYGCPHCYTLEASINQWLRNLPKDVVFKRLPAVPSENWGRMAVVFYTFEAMGLLDQYHSKIFDAMHKERLNLANPRIREEWLQKQGIDVAKYKEVEKSFAVVTKVQRAKQMTASYRIDSVPQVVVNGKYVTSAEKAGSTENIMHVVNDIIAAERRQMTATAPAGAPAKR